MNVQLVEGVQEKTIFKDSSSGKDLIKEDS